MNLDYPSHFTFRLYITLVLLKAAEEMIVFLFTKPESAAASLDQNGPNRRSSPVSFKYGPQKGVEKRARVHQLGLAVVSKLYRFYHPLYRRPGSRTMRSNVCNEKQKPKQQHE
jgi:hypothetical protein